MRAVRYAVLDGDLLFASYERLKEGVHFNTSQIEHNARDVVAESANLSLV